MISPAYERTVAVWGRLQNIIVYQKSKSGLGCYRQIPGRGPPIARPDHEYRREAMATVGYLQRERLRREAAGAFSLRGLVAIPRPKIKSGQDRNPKGSVKAARFRFNPPKRDSP
jgi:hypothetical protein